MTSICVPKPKIIRQWYTDFPKRADSWLIDFPFRNLRHIKKKPLDRVDLKAVDIDGNGKVNFQDVTVLLKYVKKKVNTIYYAGKAYKR